MVEPDPAPISQMEILRTFLIFGLLSFGGPVAHLAFMQRELVERRKWLDNDEFLEVLAAINLVPGPNSTEMAFHIGLLKGGFWGQMMAAIGFVLPAVVFSAVGAAIYVAAGTLPRESILWRLVQGILVGMKPIILVLIASAALRLGVKALDNRAMRFLFGWALLVTALTLPPLMGLMGLAPLPISEFLLLILCGALYVIWRRRLSAGVLWWLPFVGVVGQVIEGIRPTALDLFARFVLIGGTLFGSGFVLASYMERAFVLETGWLTQQQLLDALAIGQATPGPVLSTSAAAGFIMTATPNNLWAGVIPALASAVGVFLPAFVIVLLFGRVIPYVRRSAAVMDFLKGVNAGVIALLVGTFVTLTWGTLLVGGGVEWLSVGLLGAAFLASERWRWSALRLVGMGIIVGVMRAFLGWV
ncbi:MAG: chromate efflux transporter [Anaerolineales bacterium]|nr:chromate efflux transporter [Anaerolineales bacterium]